ncbi:MAG: hypothetical protein RL204_21 [Bacteroidota bacterium]
MIYSTIIFMIMKLLLSISFALSVLIAQSQTNLVTYAGNSGKEAFYDVTQIDDGTFLVSGYAENLDWIDSSIPRTELSYSSSIPNSLGTNRYGILLHISEDLTTIIDVVHFPQGAVEDIRFIKTNTQPYQPVGDLYISCNTADTDNNNGGYIIAKLNNNYINGTPSGLEWVNIVWAKSGPKDYHPWDVTSTGEVYYVSGEAHGYDWSAMYKLNNVGQRTVVENWRTHWLVAGGEWKGVPASSHPNGIEAINYSGIALKIWGRCELRSWSQAEYDADFPDGNGGIKKGTWPADFLFSGPCDPANPTANGPGYSGYSAEACCPVWGASCIVVDKRDDHVYLGMNFKSYSEDENGGTPDFEPAVIAMDNTGAIKWWSRLYHEITPQGDTVRSIPDQYVDALSIDYSNNKLVVAGRTHGNNTENFWEGNTINGNPNAYGFQNQFTGTNGNIHESWLGKLGLADGVLSNATYLAELFEGTGSLGTPHPDPNLDGWPNPNTGWPDLNTTRVAKNSLKTTSSGDVCVLAVGRRTLTTANAYQKNVNPYFGGSGCWNNFVRVYDDEFHVPLYSSLIVGEWDTLTQAGGGNTDMYGVHKTKNGVVCVGFHTADEAGNAQGNNIPVINVPSWGQSAASSQSAILVYYEAENLENPGDQISNTSSANSSFTPSFNVYPNPATDILYIDSKLNQLGNGWKYEIYSANSLLVDQASLMGSSISLDKLTNGLYTIRVRNENHTFTKSFVIAR